MAVHFRYFIKRNHFPLRLLSIRYVLFSVFLFVSLSRCLTDLNCHSNVALKDYPDSLMYPSRSICLHLFFQLPQCWSFLTFCLKLFKAFKCLGAGMQLNAHMHTCTFCIIVCMSLWLFITSLLPAFLKCELVSR